MKFIKGKIKDEKESFFKEKNLIKYARNNYCDSNDAFLHCSE